MSSSSRQNPIERLLQQLGFQKTEIEVYMALIEGGRLSATKLAHGLQLPRPTVYSAIERLISRGVVAVEALPGKKAFTALAPSALLGELKSEKRKLQEKEEALFELEELVRPVVENADAKFPLIRLYSGRASVEGMLYERFESWQSQITRYDNTWWGYQDALFVDEYRDWLEWHWKRRASDEYIKLFSNRSPSEEALSVELSNREIRMVPAKFTFSSSIWVLGDEIVLVMCKTSPNFAIRIVEPAFAQNLRTTFQLLWAATQ